MLLHDNKDLSPYNILNENEGKFLELQDNSFVSKTKIGIAQKVAYCQLKQVDVVQKGIFGQQN